MISRLNRFIADFRRSTAGNVSMIFGLSAVPLFIAAGTAIEFLNLSKARTEMQAAVDAAALAAANTYATGNTAYQATAETYISKNIPVSVDPATLDVDVSVNTTDNTLSVTASGAVESAFGDIMNLNGGGPDASEMESDGPGTISSKATVALPIFSDFHKGEIVLVMDYSWSMYDSIGGVRKYVSMRNEALKLINDLSQNGANTDVKFGLVPFSEAVRATMQRNYFDGQSGTTSWTRCIEDRKYPYNRQSSTPSTTNSTSNKTRWGYYSSSFCESYSNYNVTIRPLSTSHSGTKSQIQSMFPIGNTHISLGMEMAYHLLTPNAPYTEGVALGTSDTLKAVVLLTDGAQTSAGYGANNTWSVAAAEANLTAICNAMKTNNQIRVVTVSFDLNDVADAASEQRLANCASGPEYYFDTDSNAELATAFGVIRNQLARAMYLKE